MPKHRINIRKPSPDHKHLLIDFLTHRQQSRIWRTEENYHYKNQTFSLSHNIVKRPRMNKKQGWRYEIFGTEPLGEGSFATVYNVEDTLVINPKLKFIQFKPNKRRVAKVQKISFFKNSKAKIMREYELSKKATHLRIKKPVIDIKNKQSVTIMKKLPGRELFDLLNGRELDFLDYEMRLRLTLALLKALKNQVIDKGLLHRDLSFANILIQLRPEIVVNIIDYGLSTTKNDIMKNQRVGNMAVMAPEIFQGQAPSPKSELFSMARNISLIWGQPLYDFHNNIYLSHNDAKSAAKNLCLKDSSNDINVLLEKMLAEDPRDRITINEAIKEVKTMINFHLNNEPNLSSSATGIGCLSVHGK